MVEVGHAHFFKPLLQFSTLNELQVETSLLLFEVAFLVFDGYYARVLTAWDGGRDSIRPTGRLIFKFLRLLVSLIPQAHAIICTHDCLIGQFSGKAVFFAPLVLSY